MSNPDRTSVKWGLVATVKATEEEILNFAAFHLDAGAHRVFLYLDAPCPKAMTRLENHPKIRVTLCDRAYWDRNHGYRPGKHQVRQSLNATRAYRKQARDIEWLAHIDVDEFLYSDAQIGNCLSAQSKNTKTLRVRPIEALAGSATHFKTYLMSRPDWKETVRRLYPNYGAHLKGGFLSHLQGKIFLRTGLSETVDFRIHNGFVDNIENPSQAEVSAVKLCHFHASGWKNWRTQIEYRMKKGSYRNGLRPTVNAGLSHYDLFSRIIAEHGEDGLRAFFDEVCADSPGLRTSLAAENALTVLNLGIIEKRCRIFTD